MNLRLWKHYLACVFIFVEKECRAVGAAIYVAAVPAKLRWHISQRYSPGIEDDSPKLRQKFREFVGSCGSLLDVGCGKRSSYDAEQIIGLDPIRHLEYPFKFIKGVREQIPFPDNSFDVAVSFTSLDHAYDPRKVVSEMNRVAGRVCIGVTTTPVKDTIHTSRLTTKQLGRLLQPTRIQTIHLNRDSDFTIMQRTKGQRRRFAPITITAENVRCIFGEGGEGVTH